MQTERGAAFIDHEPILTDAEAHMAFTAGAVALSLRGLPCLGSDATIEYLAIKFALQNGSFSTVLVDQMTAAALKTLIDGADSLNWNANALRAGPTAH